MPKRAAAAAGRAPKLAKFTAGGKPRCDRCYKVVYAIQIREEVNGRIRHWECWPAFMKASREWWAACDAIRADPVRNTGTGHYKEAVDKFIEKKRQLIYKEFVMKAVNCVSKGVRDALLRTSGAGLENSVGAGLEVNVALALADK
jgi:hypothetical protein